MPIPGESESLLRTRAALRCASADLERLLVLAADLIEQAGTMPAPGPLKARAVILGLANKTLRLGRSVQILSLAGFGIEAFALTRVMVEAIATVLFLAKQNVRIITYNRKGEVQRFKAPSTHRLTADFRTTLYVAKSDLTRIRTVLDAAEIAGMKRLIPRATLDRYREGWNDIVRRVGANWAALLRDNTCAGVSIRALLATAVKDKGRRGLLALHYPTASRVTHANDIENYIREGGDGSLELIPPGPDNGAFALGHAEILLLLLADVLNKRFRLAQLSRVSAERERIDVRVAELASARRRRRRRK